MRTRMGLLSLVSLVLLSSVHLLADGIVSFSNVGAPPEDRIYRGSYVWSGTEPVFVSWEPCAGPNFHASLHWGLPGTPEQQFIQVGPAVNFLTGVGAGQFLGGGRTITSVDGGPTLSFQLRAWEGTASSYDEHIARGFGPAGKGPVFDLKTKDPLNVLETVPTIYRADGWRGFIFGLDGVTVFLVPEPSTISLAALGGAGFLLFLRRRRS